MLQDESLNYFFSIATKSRTPAKRNKNDMQEEWKSIESAVYKVAKEALGKERKYKKIKGVNIWIEEIQADVEEK